MIDEKRYEATGTSVNTITKRVMKKAHAKLHVEKSDKRLKTLKKLRAEVSDKEQRTFLTFILSSMRTGGTFSPPAVMMSSLIRPVILMKPEGAGI